MVENKGWPKLVPDHDPCITLAHPFLPSSVPPASDHHDLRGHAEPHGKVNDISDATFGTETSVIYTRPLEFAFVISKKVFDFTDFTYPALKFKTTMSIFTTSDITFGRYLPCRPRVE
jgi:hypothetical protein